MMPNTSETHERYDTNETYRDKINSIRDENIRRRAENKRRKEEFEREQREEQRRLEEEDAKRKKEGRAEVIIPIWYYDALLFCQARSLPRKPLIILENMHRMLPWKS